VNKVFRLQKGLTCFFLYYESYKHTHWLWKIKYYKVDFILYLTLSSSYEK